MALARYVVQTIALDPGRTTGYAFCITSNDKPFIAYGQQRLDHYGLYKWLCSHGSEYNIICEDFHFRRDKTGIDLYPCELIGVVNLVARLQYCYLFMQTPSIQGKKAFFSDAKLKQMGLYQKGDEFHHGRSAVKHLLHWTHFGHGKEMDIDLDKAELVTMKWMADEWI